MLCSPAPAGSHLNSVLAACVCLYRVMAVPATVIYFTCYDQLRDFLRYGLGFQGNHIPLIAGGLARCKCIKGTSVGTHWCPICNVFMGFDFLCVLQWGLWQWSALWSWSGLRCSPVGCRTASWECVSALLWPRTACCHCGGAGDPLFSETCPSPVRRPADYSGDSWISLTIDL